MSLLLPPDLGYELVNPPLVNGEGFRFGRETRVHVTRAEFGAPDIRSNDQPNARQDGISFGRDYFGGSVITFDINIKTKPTDTESAHSIYSRMATSWYTEDTHVGPSRLTPGEVSELIMSRHGYIKVTYGRPRLIQPTTGKVNSGWIPVTATFQTNTHKFYDFVWGQNDIGFIPGASGGIEFPLEFPLTTVSVSTQEDIVEVGGNTETWMLSTVYGPISQPIIDVVGYYQIITKPGFSLGVGEYLDIDPRPWVGSVMKNGTIPMRGVFTQASRRMSNMTLPPGIHQVVLKGTDPTGTASLRTRWRNAYTTW